MVGDNSVLFMYQKLIINNKGESYESIELIWVFLVGGGICVIGQILMDVFKLTPAHTTCALVVAVYIRGLGL